MMIYDGKSNYLIKQNLVEGWENMDIFDEDESWKITYEGKKPETFEFLIKLMTYPGWFRFEESHDICYSRNQAAYRLL